MTSERLFNSFIHPQKLLYPPKQISGYAPDQYKLYFAIFAAFKESMTLNLAQRSFKFINFGGNRKPVYFI